MLVWIASLIHLHKIKGAIILLPSLRHVSKRGGLGGGRKALPAPLPIPPRRDLRQEGLKNKIIRDKKAK